MVGGEQDRRHLCNVVEADFKQKHLSPGELGIPSEWWEFGDVLVNTDGRIYHVPIAAFKVLYNEPIGDEATCQKHVAETRHKSKRPRRSSSLCPRGEQMTSS